MKKKYLINKIFQNKMNLASFKKNELCSILSGHFHESDYKRMTKQQLVEMIVKHNIPMTIEYTSNTSRNLLLQKCEQFPDFIEKIHGRSKTSLLHFIHIQEEKSRDIFTDSIKTKLRQCFQSIAPFDVSEEELIQEINDCMPPSSS
ncbi:MAG: hypothetical protein CMM15_13440 [Rhodospirillaceae bacterium]|nr:hypothetical protein [Rhodospirillaceae bacterium]